MKEHLLSPGNRAALQGLITLSGALGIGALLARFFVPGEGGRGRDSGFVIFEVFAVVAILTLSGLTAYFSVLYLYQDVTISDAQLAQVSTPLVVSIILLVLLSVVARVSSLPRPWLHLPTFSATLMVALGLGFAVPILNPPIEYIVAIGVAILALGAGVSRLGLQSERADVDRNRKAERERMAKLAAMDYVPVERSLQFAVPANIVSGEKMTIVCWARGEKLYLDQTECRRLGAETARRWADVAGGAALPPRGEPVLAQIGLKTAFWPWPPKLRMVLRTRDWRDPEDDVKRIPVGDAGLFDVTSLGVVR
jgi:hypothetical protein